MRVILVSKPILLPPNGVRLLIAATGLGSFALVRRFTIQNRKKEMEIRRQMKKKVDQELGKNF